MALLLYTVGAIVLPVAIVALIWMNVASAVPGVVMPVGGVAALALAALAIALLAVCVIGLQAEFRRRAARRRTPSAQG